MIHHLQNDRYRNYHQIWQYYKRKQPYWINTPFRPATRMHCLPPVYRSFTATQAREARRFSEEIVNAVEAIVASRGREGG
jgi:hypothetical protein